MTRVRFRTELVKRGAFLCFDLPAEVSAGLGHTGRVPVRGSINTFPVRTSVFPGDQGGHYMMVPRDVQRMAGVGVGDTVRVVLEVEGIRDVAVPPDLAAALARADSARTAFERMAHSHQREYVSWIEEAKRPETRARRIDKTVKRLLQPPMTDAR